jgi:HEAT repeat protein
MSSWSWVFWVLAAVLGAGAVLMLYRGLLRDRARGRLRCPSCWFDMSGIPGLVCPECGHDARTQARLGKTRRHFGPLLAAVALGAACYLNTRVPAVLASSDWTASIPEPVLRGSARFFDKQGDALLAAGFGSTTLSRWDRILLARACGRSMLECVKTSPTGDPRQNAKFWAAEQALFGLGADAELVLPTLVDMLRSSNEGEWRGAVQVINSIGQKVPAMLPAIEGLLVDSDADVRLHGVDALEAFPGNGPATALMVARLTDPDVKVRRRAASVFDRAGWDPGGKYLQAVIASIRDPRLSTDVEGVAALAGYGGRGLAAMAEFITHPSVAVRRAVIRSLRGYGHVEDPSPGAIGALRTAVADSDSQVRYDALRALGEWGKRAGAAAPAVLELCDEGNRDLLVRCAALLAIGRMGGTGAALVLTHALEDADASVRRCAAEGLRRMGPEAGAAAVDALLAHCDDPNGDVRAEASHAVREIRGDVR